MIFLIIFTFGLGFYLLYLAAKKVAIRKSRLGLWLKEHRFTAKLAGCGLILLAAVTAALHLGLGVSVFYGLMILMTISSFMIILYPIYFPSKK